MVFFHSYVSLPEGKFTMFASKITIFWRETHPVFFVQKITIFPRAQKKAARPVVAPSVSWPFRHIDSLRMKKHPWDDGERKSYGTYMETIVIF